ncbi:hypothetical protein SAMN05216378_1138 [Paenibacillus catalpae]|uniref:Uncharacterized protein n=1 Tax=Paenibacillus catalpae TaxID=1045775 RepID=A0A1I1UN75_9BACL|nr:hypothetical protein SAMN05216378_1138 [Paenibacillus catalpae]
MSVPTVAGIPQVLISSLHGFDRIDGITKNGLISQGESVRFDLSPQLMFGAGASQRFSREQ